VIAIEKPAWELNSGLDSARPTQPGHPSAGRQNEYWRWLRPSPGKKGRVLRSSRPVTRTADILTQLVRYLADLGCMLA